MSERFHLSSLPTLVGLDIMLCLNNMTHCDLSFVILFFHSSIRRNLGEGGVIDEEVGSEDETTYNALNLPGAKARRRWIEKESC